MKAIKLNKSNGLLLLIMLLASFLRFYSLGDFSYSNDEMSALVRCDFDNFSDLIQYGVQENDMHPAGVQVFLYCWSSLVGTGELLIRLPFILAGILSVFVVFKLGEHWFNRNTGLVSAAIFCCLEYTILYAQVARPYSLGILFTLLTAYAFTKIFFSKFHKPKYYVAFIIFASFTMYTHYYAMLTTGLICLTGLFFLNKYNYKPYLLSGIVILALYIPHFSIFQAQFSRGGLGRWLGEPKSTWLLEFLYSTFNSSIIVIFVIISLMIVGFFSNINKPNINKFTIIGLLWFFLSFLAGYLYSKAENPILQPSVLTFSFAFLIIPISAIIAQSEFKRTGIFTGIILITLTSSTLFENDFYSKNQFGVFKELIQQNKDWDEKYGAENIEKAMNVNSPKYAHFYDRQLRYYPTYVSYHSKEKEDILNLYNEVIKSKKQYFSFAWSTRVTPKKIYELIRTKYPEIIENKVYNNSQITLFKRNKNYSRKEKIEFYNNFDSPNKNWSSKPQQLDTLGLLYSNCIKLDDKEIFSPVFEKSVKELDFKKGQYIAVEAWIKQDQKDNFSVAYQVKRNGKTVLLNNGKEAGFYDNLNQYTPNNRNWNKVVFARNYDSFLQPDDVIKIYFWNSGGKHTVRIDDLIVRIVEN